VRTAPFYRSPSIYVCAVLLVGLILMRSTGISGVASRRFPTFEDWSTRHVAYPHVGYQPQFDIVARDPRSLFHWWQRTEEAPFRHRRRRPLPAPIVPRTSMSRDWSIHLGTAGTANGMYPAKFSFDVTATPNCANDFVVFPIAAAGSATQPNLVAFNNLYSGTAGATGICNRTATASDTGVAATVYWSYNVQAVSGGAVTTSPVISYDVPTGELGTKVAFVESAAGAPAHFHVLAFKAKDGQNSSNLQSVLSPKTVNTFVTAAPVDGSGTATDLALGSSTTGTDTLSSPFVDYTYDKAYVGNDIGVLYRIKDVFCLKTNPDCQGTSKPVPSLDTTWGTGGAITVCSGRLTAPVLDYMSYNVFVGCSDGKLYSISQMGAIKSITVGDGVAAKTYGAIVDPPLVDSLNGFVYAVSGSASSGANGVLVQAKTDLSSFVAVPVGSGNQCAIHAPALNNAYYTSPTSAGALIYVAGVTGTVSQPCTASSTGGALALYGVGFGTGGVMTAGAPAHTFSGGTPGNEWAPLLEFYNSTTAVDWLFASVICNPPPNMASVNITTAFPGGFGSVVSEGLGTSGMIIDNVSSSAQASSLYFNSLFQNATCNNTTSATATGGCAVKLTQAGLQ